MKSYPKYLSNSVWNAVNKTKLWFDKNAESYNKNIFLNSRIESDNAKGCIYVFYRANGSVLYVGQTGKRLKYRALYSQNNFKNVKWWKMVKTLKFVNVENKADRIILTALLTVELKPTNNHKTLSKDIHTMGL